VVTPATFDIRLDRYESKYIVPAFLVPQVRDFIRPFCRPDPYAHGDPPEYVVTTLQFDTPDLALYRAKVNEADARFKLRARIYGEVGESAVYVEVKRKVARTIVKSRAKVPFEAWGERLGRDRKLELAFPSRNEENEFLDFIRLVRETGARPVMLIRYHRESYYGANDPYARVTFDRRLVYQPTAAWDTWGRGGRWRTFDSPLAQNKNYRFSGVVLEIKTLNDAPLWMMDLIVRFNLERTGNCKYASAVWQESLFNPRLDVPYTADDLTAS
jgi:SPX domain protein involved in polyphosphate accumulation